jgi:hypothetical protein
MIWIGPAGLETVTSSRPGTLGLRAAVTETFGRGTQFVSVFVQV